LNALAGIAKLYLRLKKSRLENGQKNYLFSLDFELILKSSIRAKKVFFAYFHAFAHARLVSLNQLHLKQCKVTDLWLFKKKTWGKNSILVYD
jgi:hypothetical protein